MLARGGRGPHHLGMKRSDRLRDLQILAILVPALCAGIYETLRHSVLTGVLPFDLGTPMAYPAWADDLTQGVDQGPVHWPTPMSERAPPRPLVCARRRTRRAA